MELSHRCAQSLHPKLILEDHVDTHDEEEVHLISDVTPDVLRQDLHAHEVKVAPPSLPAYYEYLEGLQRVVLRFRQLQGLIHHDVEDHSIARHEEFAGRLQEWVQVLASEAADSKHSQAHGDVLLLVIFLQGLSVKGAFPYDRGQPVCGRDNIQASPEMALTSRCAESKLAHMTLKTPLSRGWLVSFCSSCGAH